MASNQTNQVENLKELINDWFTEMLEVLEAYGESHHIADFIDILFSCLPNDQAQQILEDIKNLEYNHFEDGISLQVSMVNLRQHMQKIGLETEGLVNAFNTARDQYLLTTLVQRPMENLRQRIGKIVSNARFVTSKNEFSNLRI